MCCFGTIRQRLWRTKHGVLGAVEVWLGRSDATDENIIGTASGVKLIRTIRRRPVGEQYSAEAVQSMRGTPWQLTTGHADNYQDNFSSDRRANARDVSTSTVSKRADTCHCSRGLTTGSAPVIDTASGNGNTRVSTVAQVTRAICKQRLLRPMVAAWTVRQVLVRPAPRGPRWPWPTTRTRGTR